jgi:hypothetical protein
VSPSQYGFDQLNELRGGDYWKAVRPGSKEDGQFHYAELRWPVIRQYAQQGVKHDIEPGETDLFVATYLVKCGTRRRFRVATDVIKPIALRRGDQDKVRAWTARTFVDTRDACRELGGGNDVTGT